MGKGNKAEEDEEECISMMGFLVFIASQSGADVVVVVVKYKLYCSSRKFRKPFAYWAR